MTDEKKIEQRQVIAVAEQKIISSKDHKEVEKNVNSFLLELRFKQNQIQNISHLLQGEILAAIITYLRPLTEEEKKKIIIVSEEPKPEVKEL